MPFRFLLPYIRFVNTNTTHAPFLSIHLRRHRSAASGVLVFGILFVIHSVSFIHFGVLPAHAYYTSIQGHSGSVGMCLGLCEVNVALSGENHVDLDCLLG